MSHIGRRCGRFSEWATPNRQARGACGPFFMQQGILVLWLSDIGDNIIESQDNSKQYTTLYYSTESVQLSTSEAPETSVAIRAGDVFPLPCMSKLGQPRRNAPGVGSIPFWSLRCCRVVVWSCSLAWGTQFHTRKQYPMLGDDWVDWMIFIRSPSEGWSQALQIHILLLLY